MIGDIDPSEQQAGGPMRQPPALNQVTFSRRELNRILDARSPPANGATTPSTF